MSRTKTVISDDIRETIEAERRYRRRDPDMALLCVRCLDVGGLMGRPDSPEPCPDCGKVRLRFRQQAEPEEAETADTTTEPTTPEAVPEPEPAGGTVELETGQQGRMF